MALADRPTKSATLQASMTDMKRYGGLTGEDLTRAMAADWHGKPVAEFHAAAKERRAEVVKMRQSGMTFAAIAARLGISDNRASTLFRYAVQRGEA